MATNKTGRRLESFQSALHVKNIMPDIVFVDGNLEEAGFLAYLNQIEWKSTVTPEFQFYEDAWLPLTDTTSASASAAVTTISVTTIAGFIPGLLYRNTRTNEVILVISKDDSAGTILVQRGMGRDTTNSTGTAAAAMNSGDTLARLGNAVGETSRRQIAQSTVPTLVFNYAQKVRAEVEMSDVQRKVKHVTGNDWSYQLDRAFKQYRKDMNGLLYDGERNKTTVNGQTMWLTGGLRFFVTSNILAGSGTLHEYQLDQWLTDEGHRYGPQEKLLLASSNVLRAFTEMAKDRISIQRVNLGTDGLTLGVTVNRYVSPTGRSVVMMEDRYLTATQNGTAYLLDMNVIRLRDFSGDGLDGKPRLIPNTQDVDDDGTAATIIGHFGLEVGPELHHGKMTGITAGAMGRSVS